MTPTCKSRKKTQHARIVRGGFSYSKTFDDNHSFLILMMLVPDDERGCPKFSLFLGVSPPPTSFRWPQQGNGTTPANPAPHTIAISPKLKIDTFYARCWTSYLQTFFYNSHTHIEGKKEKKKTARITARVYQGLSSWSTFRNSIQITAEVGRNLDKMILNIVKNKNKRKKKMLEPNNPKPRTATF